MGNKPSSRGSATEIAARLRTEIELGEIRPNDRLPAERELAGRFGISRGTVRKAIEQLASEGMVYTRKGSGTFVSLVASADIRSSFQLARPLELMDARFAFEPHICRLAVLNAVGTDFDKLDELLTGMEQHAENAEEFAELDALFHIKLAESTRNSLLVWIAEQVTLVRGQHQWTRMRDLTLEPKIISVYNAQHRGIVDAIKLREPEVAANAMKDHLETARLSLTRASAT